MWLNSNVKEASSSREKEVQVSPNKCKGNKEFKEQFARGIKTTINNSMQGNSVKEVVDLKRKKRGEGELKEPRETARKPNQFFCISLCCGS